MAHRLFSLGQTCKLLNVRIYISKSIFPTKEKSGGFPMSNAPKHEILVVDDEVAIRDSLALVLQSGAMTPLPPSTGLTLSCN